MSTLASSFTYTGFSISAPVGTIVSYLGTTDPNGWIICDGQQRTGGAGRYKELFPILNAAMGVTSNTQDSVTPPDLRSRVLYGKAATGTTTSVTGGSATVTLNVNQMPVHKHTINIVETEHTHTATINDPGHRHNNTLNDPGHRHGWNFGTQQDDEGFGTSNREFTEVSSNTEPPENPINTAYTGITIGNVAAYTGIGVTIGNTKTNISATSVDAGGNTAVDILPPYFTVNYIIKY
jgi:microcystin-dependent protein